MSKKTRDMKISNMSVPFIPFQSPNIIAVICIGNDGSQIRNNLSETSLDKITFIPYSNNITEHDIVKSLKDIKILFVVTNMCGETECSTSTAIVKCAKELGILIITAVVLTYESEEDTSEKIGLISSYINTFLMFSNETANEGIAALIESILQMLPDADVPIDLSDLQDSMCSCNRATIYSSLISTKLENVNIVEDTLSSPLSIICNNEGVKDIILHVSYGEIYPTIAKMYAVMTQLSSQFNISSNLIFGTSCDKSLGFNLRTTIIIVGDTN